MTQQQDNDLDVLVEWIRFYREIHGFTAFVIYDNASVTYDVAASPRASGWPTPTSSWPRSSGVCRSA